MNFEITRSNDDHEILIHYVISTYLRQHEIYLVMRVPVRTIVEAVVNDFNRNVTVSSASVDVAAEKKKSYNLRMKPAFYLWVSITSDLYCF